MTGTQRLSEAVYVGLCREEVSMRRDITDMNAVIQNELKMRKNVMLMSSGSYKEGFRLSGSDQDYMTWLQDHKVICELSQAQQYRQHGTTLFLMECVESRPGFVLLQLLTPSNKRKVSRSCVKINYLDYLSSSLYRENSLPIIVSNRGGMKYEEHGPCCNFRPPPAVQAELEIDLGFCFSCDFWPPQAASWIQRCRSWPPPPVCYEIIVSGCHFMAIGSKGSPNGDKEWRLSFSQAEEKLVYAMNHSQFLVYGLLKLFLKDVINQFDQEKLLCSYFLKTAVFWEIQENNILYWCPQNILSCFWACYKRVIKWVFHGYCPNFFVTENNMFFDKILGPSQIALYAILHELYEKGISCLLYCKSIRSYLVEFISNPTNVINLHERNKSSEKKHVFDIYGNFTSCTGNFINIGKRKLFAYLQTSNALSKTNLTPIQLLFLRTNEIRCVSLTALSIQQMCVSENRAFYIANNSTCNMLKTLACSGFVPEMLFLAMYYCNTCRYIDALSVLHKIEVTIMQHSLTYKGNLEKAIVEIGGQCLLDRFISDNLSCIMFKTDIVYVNQLKLEQRISAKNSVINCRFLSVPTLVLLRMLYVLCYSHVNTERRQEALHSLYILVHHDNDTYKDVLRDISYEILGICQEICGDFQAAVDSYNLSLSCFPYHEIREASLIRIQHALSKLGNLC